MGRTFLRWGIASALLLATGILFLPLYRCALCDLYKAPRSERGGCWCNERSKVNLVDWWSLRTQVREELAQKECGGSAIYPHPCTTCGSREGWISLTATEADNSRTRHVLCRDCAERRGYRLPRR